MTGERPGPNVIFDRMANFARRCAVGGGGGTNFCLEGPIDVPTQFTTFIGLFVPPNPSAETGYAIASQERVEREKLFSKVLQLELPQRVASQPIVDDEVVRRASLARLFRSGLPFVVVGIGRTRDTNQEAVYLFFANGISPATALREIQERTRSRLAKLN